MKKALVQTFFWVALAMAFGVFIFIYDGQQKALEYIRQSFELSNEEKKRFFKSANTNLGSSALCLSGGGSFGYCALS